MGVIGIFIGAIVLGVMSLGVIAWRAFSAWWKAVD
jgi:hypothetical protein